MALFERKKQQGPEEFWKEYEQKIGQKVLGYSLGQYIEGWDEYTQPMWGLVVAAEDSFIFHHFPHEGWLQALSRNATGGEGPKEKIITIHRDRLVSVRLDRQRSLWHRLIAYRPPRLVVRYRLENGTESELIAETDMRCEYVAQAIAGIIDAGHAD
jgi:hypothetical protein